ncbi:hypothetical protein D046_0124B, partial [Vibrio parahaemolyticus V-223/04]
HTKASHFCHAPNI